MLAALPVPTQQRRQRQTARQQPPNPNVQAGGPKVVHAEADKNQHGRSREGGQNEQAPILHHMPRERSQRVRPLFQRAATTCSRAWRLAPIGHDNSASSLPPWVRGLGGRRGSSNRTPCPGQ